MDGHNYQDSDSERSDSLERQSFPYKTTTSFQTRNIKEENDRSSSNSPTPTESLDLGKELEVTYKLLPQGTTRGRPLLVDSLGYSYTQGILKTPKPKKTYWVCRVRNKHVKCSASVIQQDGIFTPGRYSHCHPMQPGAEKILEVAAEVKQRAKEDLLLSASDIVKTVIMEKMDEDDPKESINTSLLIRITNRFRHSNKLAQPQNINFELGTEFIPKNFLQKDICTASSRHLLFSTQEQLALLNKAKIIFLDATFKFVKLPFEQLLSIHTFVETEARKELHKSLLFLSIISHAYISIIFIYQILCMLHK